MLSKCHLYNLITISARVEQITRQKLHIPKSLRDRNSNFGQFFRRSNFALVNKVAILKFFRRSKLFFIIFESFQTFNLLTNFGIVFFTFLSPKIRSPEQFWNSFNLLKNASFDLLEFDLVIFFLQGQLNQRIIK